MVTATEFVSRAQAVAQESGEGSTEQQQPWPTAASPLRLFGPQEPAGAVAQPATVSAKATAILSVGFIISQTW